MEGAAQHLKNPRMIFDDDQAFQSTLPHVRAATQAALRDGADDAKFHAVRVEAQDSTGDLCSSGGQLSERDWPALPALHCHLQTQRQRRRSMTSFARQCVLRGLALEFVHVQSKARCCHVSYRDTAGTFVTRVTESLIGKIPRALSSELRDQNKNGGRSRRSTQRCSLNQSAGSVFIH